MVGGTANMTEPFWNLKDHLGFKGELYCPSLSSLLCLAPFTPSKDLRTTQNSTAGNVLHGASAMLEPEAKNTSLENSDLTGDSVGYPNS